MNNLSLLALAVLFLSQTSSLAQEKSLPTPFKKELTYSYSAKDSQKPKFTNNKTNETMPTLLVHMIATPKKSPALAFISYKVKEKNFTRTIYIGKKVRLQPTDYIIEITEIDRFGFDYKILGTTR